MDRWSILKIVTDSEHYSDDTASQEYNKNKT